MMHGNILVITSSSSYWPDLGKAFERKGFVPAIWFGDYRFDQFAREEFPSCEVLPIKDFHIGLPSKKYKNVPNAEFLTSIEFLRLKNQAMKLMDRQDEIREFGRLERDVYFYEMFFRLYDLIIQKDIKFLVAGKPLTVLGISLLTASANTWKFLHFILSQTYMFHCCKSIEASLGPQ